MREVSSKSDQKLDGNYRTLVGEGARRGGEHENRAHLWPPAKYPQAGNDYQMTFRLSRVGRLERMRENLSNSH